MTHKAVKGTVSNVIVPPPHFNMNAGLARLQSCFAWHLSFLLQIL
jgi:hypothetical protein